MRTRFTLDWTAAEDTLLLRLWSQGVTARLIADRIGRTRNAIIGRAHRLQKRLGTIMREPPPISPPPKRKRKKPAKPTYTAKREADFVSEPVQLRMPPAPPTARRVSLLELGPRDCRFIVTDHMTRDHLYCGVPSELADEFGNNCYCRFHYRVMRVCR